MPTAIWCNLAVGALAAFFASRLLAMGREAELLEAEIERAAAKEEAEARAAELQRAEMAASDVDIAE